ncbi:S-methyl-5'-thioadenosine phosphorylase [Nigerium massiliense]|uniref:S-methyl-5'-thioadenosine phosphorylase n=1 Tax=Nigerium massiliense TaxID=1522317 RepID=UPI00058C636E|nr:S-methyl-5'-thioadenosine phosphorylase [Nigerium massiliense]
MQADIGIIGGSGFYSFFDDPRRVEVDTPFGPPSAAISVGEVQGRRVAFLPRHGDQHQFVPHKVNYRANLWALRSLGVRQVLAPCAVGSLQEHLRPGTLVVPDQVIDRTYRAGHTVWEEPGPVVHVSFADPYCPRGRASVARAGEAAGQALTDGGTLVVINGPRFSSRAESRWHAAAGGSVVGMTGMPEASVARELAMCFTTICLVTDMDAGVEGDSGVSHAEVLEAFGRNIEKLKGLLYRVIPELPADDACACQHALDGMDLPRELP